MTVLKMILSPLERAVLAECAEWRGLDELQADLLPEFAPEAVESAVRFLKRRRLLAVAGFSSLNIEAYKQSEYGTRILALQARRDERELRLVGGAR